MKKIIHLSSIVLLLAVAFTFNSCDKDTPFDFTYTLAPIEFTSPFFPANSLKTFSDTTFTRDIEAQLNQYGASLQDVSSMQLKAITVNILSSGQTFDGVDYFESYINSTGLPETKLAYKSPVPQTGLTSLSLDNNYSELVDFIKADSFRVDLRGYNSVDLPPTDMNIQISFHIKGMIPAKK